MKLTLTPFVFIFSLLLAACGNLTPTSPTSAPLSTITSTPPPTITPTPDLCSAANLPSEVTKANKLMREFDDYSSLASNTPQAQLIIIVPNMQRILRDTEDLQIPPCLQTLKQLEISHMNLVIQVLLAFMNSSDTQAINDGIAKARELHAQYDIEIARLLGITLVVPITATPDVNVTPSATAIAAYITNPGPSIINLHSSPSVDAPEVGLLDVQVSTAALGKSADAQWIKVEVPTQPGQTAWVYASLVQLSVPIDQLPVTE